MDGKSEQKTPSSALREWIRRARADCHMSLRELDAIADHMDSELVELPNDREGKPIHIGDVMYTDDGREEKVIRIYITRDRDFSVCCLTRDMRNGWYAPSKLTHTRPDSLERIADELDAWVDRPASYKEHKEFHTFADRIRKLAAKEQGNE